MDLKNLEKITKRPALYEPGNAIMWIDKYISKQLLEVHLNPDIDLATRKPESVENTLGFISRFCDTPDMEILDLGCGPGVYAEKLALKGHRITGIDFSQNSIDYARVKAKEKNLNINYACQNYLTLDFIEKFDLIFIIYTDFGVLIPEDRKVFLQNVFRALKPGGIFIFDILNDRNLDKKFIEQQSWNIENGGFWQKDPYLVLSNGFKYPDHKVFLNQHTVIDEDGKSRIYRFWAHYFGEKELIPLLSEHGFEHIQTYSDVLPEGDFWNGENVTFYKTNKP
jgi:SAM-dependent methyltransferase